MTKPRVLVLTGDGINCERETSLAFEWAGARSTIVHVNDLIDNRVSLNDFQIFTFPGGFSFADDLGSGQVLSLKLKSHLSEQLREFVEKKGAIIGICNGFQMLVKLGLLPFPLKDRAIGLAPNIQGTFIDKWVNLEVDQNSNCIWTTDIDQKNIELPIRHGEGRVTLKVGEEKKIYNTMIENKQVVLRYSETVNGSYEKIAGICDPTGRIFGLMPHPEAFISNIQHPILGQTKTRDENGLGLEIFKSAINNI